MDIYSCRSVKNTETNSPASGVKTHFVRPMKDLYFTFLVFATCCIVLLNPVRADQAKDRILPPLIIQNLKTTHYEPRVIDDKFSEDLFKNYIKNLDYEKKFFLKSDIEKLNKYFQLLDDELSVGKNEFYIQSVALVKQRISECQKYYTQALAAPFDFTKKDSIIIDPDHIEFAGDIKALEARWATLMKYRSLLKYADLIEEQEKKKKDTTAVTQQKTKTLVELEADARDKVRKNYDTWFKGMSRLTDVDRLAVFINSMTSLYDPHTNYFPPEQKENFDISMTGQLEGIGARLQEKDGYIVVASILPGSPSHRQGELEAGDKILAVAQADAEPVDIVDMPLDDAVQLIRGKKGTQVRLTVEKVNGSRKVIPIIRDVVIIEETYAKSARLGYANNSLQIGYIKLPLFYADFNRQGAPNSAEDVEKEIDKLKSEGIQGLILDLRNNSGGSLKDAVDMTGLFITTGAIVQVKTKQDDAKVLKDNNPRMQYDGPLVILINSNSASASEILAAAIQDYKRGVIIGSGNSSYGKGTVQTFFNLDDYAQSPYIKARELGSLKVTTQKFYRINGGATQKKGVIPDIVLPDLFMYLDVGEKEQDYAMGWDKIKPLDFDLYKQPFDLAKLKTKSKDRVSHNALLQLVEKGSLSIKEKKDKKVFTLVYDEYIQELKQAEQENKERDDLKVKLEGLHISNLKADIKKLGSDSLQIDLNKKWIEELEKDVYLHEAIMIIKDMIG